MDPVIIIGTGIAAYTLAREFRKLDTSTPLLLITADNGHSYSKPMLSNALTKGKTAQQLVMYEADQMAERLNAKIMSYTIVKALTPQTHSIILSDGQILKYSKLVLALGAKSISIPFAGNATQDILSVNSRVDYTLFREKLLNAKRVAIIGPGLIGCEFANDLLNVGIAVSIIGPNKEPLDNLLPEIFAKDLRKQLQNIGADWHLTANVRAINSTDHDSYLLSMDNGNTLEADLVLSAVGLHPHIDLAHDAGLSVNRGIMTDIYLQTSADDIYAIGDCAEVNGHNLLFIAPIIECAKALAHTLTDTNTAVSYPAMPVAIKTPVYPLVVALPPPNTQGNWQFKLAESGFGYKGLFIAENDELLGFILSADMVSEKKQLTSQLAPLFSS